MVFTLLFRSSVGTRSRSSRSSRSAESPPVCPTVYPLVNGFGGFSEVTGFLRPTYTGDIYPVHAADRHTSPRDKFLHAEISARLCASWRSSNNGIRADEGMCHMFVRCTFIRPRSAICYLLVVAMELWNVSRNRSVHSIIHDTVLRPTNSW